MVREVLFGLEKPSLPCSPQEDGLDAAHQYQKSGQNASEGQAGEGKA